MRISNPIENLFVNGESNQYNESIHSKIESEIPIPSKSGFPTEILPLDADSPDRHVPRDPRMIRLTGHHPFNSEAPLTDLYEAGKPF